jgi:hypothetical protein
MKQYREGYDENGRIEGREEAPEVTYTPSFGERVENFWYHYKWHSLVAIFLVFTILVCSLQMCERESYDIYITYAGGKEISRTNKDGDVSEYAAFVSAFASLGCDYDGDGVSAVSFSSLFILSDEEIEKIESELGYEVNYTLMENDKSVLSDRMIMLSDDYYICLFAHHIYEAYKNVQGVSMFAPISSYLPEGSSAELYATDAVKLSSLDVYTLPALCTLPEDTLVCLRAKSAISSHFNATETERVYARAEEYLRTLLSYTAE